MVNGVASYGGGCFSHEATRICRYCKRMGIPIHELHMDRIARHDRVMIRIVGMGEEASAPRSKIALKHIPAELENHYFIDEKEGLKTVIFHPNAFKADQAKKILRERHLSETEKLELIWEVLDRQFGELENCRGLTYTARAEPKLSGVHAAQRDRERGLARSVCLGNETESLCTGAAILCTGWKPLCEGSLATNG